MARISLGLPSNPVFQTVRLTASGGGITFSGGGTITGASGQLTLTPSGATAVHFQFVDYKMRFTEDGAGTDLPTLHVLTTATSPTTSNFLFASNGTTAYINAASTVNINTGGSIRHSFTANTVGLAGVVTETNNSLGATSTDGIVLVNTTDASVGTPVQIAPRIRLRGEALATTPEPDESHTLDWVIENLPVSGATVSSIFKLKSSINGAPYTEPLTLTSAGVLTKPGGTIPLITTNTAITSGAGAGLGTLTNAPSAGDPDVWIPFNNNGTPVWVPAWAA